jgi:hypothetical protein
MRTGPRLGSAIAVMALLTGACAGLLAAGSSKAIELQNGAIQAAKKAPAAKALPAKKGPTSPAVPARAIPKQLNTGAPKPGPIALPRGPTLPLNRSVTTALPKGLPPALAKGTSDLLPKGATGTLPKGTTAALPKGPAVALPKGPTAALPNGATAALPKGPGAALPKGPTTALAPATAALPKAAPAAIPRQLANRVIADRPRFEADHRREIFLSRLRLPPRPLPGERGFTGIPPAGESRFATSEMVFHVGANVSPQIIADAARRLGLTTIASESIAITGGTLVHFRVAAGRPIADTVRALEAERIGTAQPNYVYVAQQQPARDPPQQSPEPPAAEPAAELSADLATGVGDPGQYVVAKFRLAEVHRFATGNNVLIAVIDSEIDSQHPDLANAVIERFEPSGRLPQPDLHGTGMVGAIAAHRKLMGIAPGARILAVRAFSPEAGKSPQATTRDIIAGLDWAIRKGARIINMSFAGPYDPMLALAMKRAHDQGVVLIAAAGNAGAKSPPLYPAADPNVIAVTATDENDQLYQGSVRGPHVALAAPGVDVMVPAPANSYQLTTGTSVATAHVSGVAALLIERQPTIDAASVHEILTASARRLGTKYRDDQFGFGLVDPAAALAELDERIAHKQVAGTTRPAAPRGPVSVR